MKTNEHKYLSLWLLAFAVLVLPTIWHTQVLAQPMGGGYGQAPGGFGQAPGGPGPGYGGGFGAHYMPTPEELLAFLQQYEPALAQKLKQLHRENPQQLHAQLPTLLRLYVPVMRQMQYDPQAGQLGLREIELRLKAQDLVESIKTAQQADLTEPQTDQPEPKSDQTEPKKQLRATLSDLFDVIIEQEQLRLTHFETRFEDWSEHMMGPGPGQNGPGAFGPDPGMGGPGPGPDMGPGYGPGPGAQGMGPGYGPGPGAQGMGPGYGPGPGAQGMGPGYGPGPGTGGPGMSSGFGGPGSGGPGMGMGGGRPMMRFQRRLQERQRQIENWKEHKQAIVNQRMLELLGGYQPFPWGR